MLITVKDDSEATIEVKGKSYTLRNSALARDIMLCIQNEPKAETIIKGMSHWISWAEKVPLKRIIPMPFGSFVNLWTENTGDPGWAFGIIRARYYIKAAIQICAITEEVSDEEINFCAHELLKLCSNQQEKTRVSNTEITIFTDGSAHNLGDGKYANAGAGLYSIDLGITRGFHLGDGISSNCCEYEAIIAAMRIADNRAVRRLKIKTDSELCVRQILKGCLDRPGYNCSDPKLIQRMQVVKELISNFAFFDIEHVRRGFNSEADDAAEQCKKEAKVPLPSTWSPEFVAFTIDKI